jgi:hypothetical protein
MSTERPEIATVAYEDAPVASPEERVDFLKEAIAFTEASIRAFDTKAQIATAAFILSMSPLWSILNTTCPDASSRPIVAALVCGFVSTIMTYFFVLWPVRKLQEAIRNIRTKGLFYVHNPAAAASTYPARLKELSVEPELAGELLKLSAIRDKKARRFYHALSVTGLFYMFAFAVYLLLRHCA